MTSKWKFARTSTVALLCACLVGGCGNYSNDDLDFQLALPEQGDMDAKLQVSVSRDDSAEYYRATRDAVREFNSLVFALTALVEAVRGYTPTSRNGDERTWGPFADDKHPGWETRVVMQRSTESQTLLHMDYWVQVRQVGQDDSGWVSLLVGQYTSQGSARTGYGEIHFNVQTARAATYPVDSDPGLVNLDHLDVCYDRSGNPSACPNENGGVAFVDMRIVNLSSATTKAGHYVYELAEDNSGHMQFDWQGTTDSGLPITATMDSRWLASSAGRADLVVDLTPNLPNETTLGTDCWGVDTVAAYSYRLRDDVTQQKRDQGDASLCVF